eukprot:gene13147-biopygen9510
MPIASMMGKAPDTRQTPTKWNAVGRRGRPRKATEGRGSRQKALDDCGIQVAMDSFATLFSRNFRKSIAGPGRRGKRQTPAEDYGAPRKMLRAVEDKTKLTVPYCRMFPECGRRRRSLRRGTSWNSGEGGGRLWVEVDCWGRCRGRGRPRMEWKAIGDGGRLQRAVEDSHCGRTRKAVQDGEDGEDAEYAEGYRGRRRVTEPGGIRRNIVEAMEEVKDDDDAEGNEDCRTHSNDMEHTRTARSGYPPPPIIIPRLHIMNPIIIQDFSAPP